MKIRLMSVIVEAQCKALKVYTEILGFAKKTEVPMGEFQWLTVVSPDEPPGAELLLEPTQFPPAKVYQKALFDAGIPAAALAVDDIEKEYERLVSRAVVFRFPPAKAGQATIAILDDTCGNLIQLYQAP